MNRDAEPPRTSSGVALVALLLLVFSIQPAEACDEDKNVMSPPPTNEHASVVQNVQAAVSIAEKALLALGPQRQFVLLPEQTIERSFGWVFFYVPKRFKESGNPGDLIPGNGPLVVYRANGGTEYLSSSVPPAKAIFELETRLASARR